MCKTKTHTENTHGNLLILGSKVPKQVLLLGGLKGCSLLDKAIGAQPLQNPCLCLTFQCVLAMDSEQNDELIVTKLRGNIN